MDTSTNKSKKKFKILIIAVIVLIVIVGGGLLFYNSGISAVSSSDKEVTVEIPQGSSSYQVLDALDDAGLIKNKLCAKMYVKFSSPDNLQANVYVLNKNMSLAKMLDIINKGDLKYVLRSEITVIDGATLPQAAEEVSKELGFTKKAILAKWSDKKYLKSLIKKYWFLEDAILDPDIMYPLEGYFYPETYYIMDKKPTLEGVTEQMLDMMDKKLSEIKDDIKDTKMSVHEFLSFASVVQAESLFEKDRPKIAGVFFNRMKDNMKLQSDITVLYALQEKRVDVSVADTAVDSKYNTYKYEGLPIGPVCMVPLATMKDCINYEKSDYLFFFATKDGTVIYSKTYQEHQKAVKENKWY